MVYKDQPQNTPGQTVTVEVRYRGTALQGPFEQHDLSEFCCHPNQAMMAARYLLARRRYTSHSVELTMGRRGAQLNPGDIVSVDLAVSTTEGDGITDMHYYTVESVTEGQGGQVQLQLIHFPTSVNDAGKTISVIAREIHEGQVSVQ
jgi:predicted phage tail protein